MEQREYDFLTGKNKDPKAFQHCRNFGWCAGLDTEGRPVLTKRGTAWVKAYQTEDNYKRIEAI